MSVHLKKQGRFYRLFLWARRSDGALAITLRSTCELQIEQYCLILPGCSLRSGKHWRHSCSADCPQMKHSRWAGADTHGQKVIQLILSSYYATCESSWLLTVVQKIRDVKLRGGNDVREHLVLVTKSRHLHHQTRWHLRTKNDWIHVMNINMNENKMGEKTCKCFI